VTKWPRFTFEKFPQTNPELTIQMKSVGEAMAIGRTFKESLQKAIRSLEIDRYSLDNRHIRKDLTDNVLRRKSSAGTAGTSCGTWPRRFRRQLTTRADFRNDQDRPVVPGQYPRDRRA
jgi:hypothetical protein